MLLELHCSYCGKRFREAVSTTSEVEALRCPICKDRNLKNVTKEALQRDVFGYNSDAPKSDAWIKRN